MKFMSGRNPHDEKTPPDGGRVWYRRSSVLCADDVARLKAFGAFEQIELQGLTLVERAVAVLLNGGEMYEDVLSRGALGCRFHGGARRQECERMAPGQPNPSHRVQGKNPSLSQSAALAERETKSATPVAVGFGEWASRAGKMRSHGQPRPHGRLGYAAPISRAPVRDGMTS